MSSSLSDRENCFIFETSEKGQPPFCSLYLTSPKDILVLEDPGDIPRFMELVERLSEKYYLAGFFSYELGYCLEPKLRSGQEYDLPLAVFMVFDRPAVFDHEKDRFTAGDFTPPSFRGYRLTDPELNMTHKDYMTSIGQIKRHIQKGDIYQANFTMKYKFGFTGSDFDLYRDLKQRQEAAYNVFMRLDGMSLISTSPELFFIRKNDIMTVKPMKGTTGRGRDLDHDKKKMDFLSRDEKNRSENLMIVDLLRNDLGRVSLPGTVRVRKMFEAEKYRTLIQMTSTVESRLKKGTRLLDIMRAVFPSGSVTGAPKIRSMQIIREKEKEDRNVYCGALGFFKPGGDALFNVAIRTVLIQGENAEMGIGSGIVYDSDPEREYEECLLKGRFLAGREKNTGLKIIETMLFDKEIKDLEMHLDRMERSAMYFGFDMTRAHLRERSLQRTSGLRGRKKIRLLLDRGGKIHIENREISLPGKGPLKICLSGHRTDPENIFLYHKTTNRGIYDKELKAARKKGFYDAIFVNDRGFVTEGAITNVYVHADGIYYTPPAEQGLLNGIVRSRLLREGRARERKLTLEDLRSGVPVYISNSIAGLHRAELHI